MPEGRRPILPPSAQRHHPLLPIDLNQPEIQIRNWAGQAIGIGRHGINFVGVRHATRSELHEWISHVLGNVRDLGKVHVAAQDYDTLCFCLSDQIEETLPFPWKISPLIHPFLVRNDLRARAEYTQFRRLPQLLFQPDPLLCTEMGLARIFHPEGSHPLYRFSIVPLSARDPS